MKFNLIVLGGGRGSRLWPVSTEDAPKQFLKFENSSTLFQRTISRNLGLFQNLYLLSQEKYFFQLIDQLEGGFKEVQFLLEPYPKGTLPILILALLNMDLEDYFLMTPSDLEIEDLSSYQIQIEEIKRQRDPNHVVIFGKKPLYPHTGFGYIRHQCKKVIEFIEKPQKEIAEILIQQGECFWNCGMIFSKVSTFLKLIKDQAKDWFEICVKIKKTQNESLLTYPTIRFNPDLYFQLTSKSIDHAILEKSQNLVVEPIKFDWKDCGSFESIADFKQSSNNLLLVNSTNVQVTGVKKKIVVQNLTDLSIVETEDQVFILKL